MKIAGSCALWHAHTHLSPSVAGVQVHPLTKLKLGSRPSDRNARSRPGLSLIERMSARKLIQLLEQMLTSANSMLRPCAYAAHLYERHGSQNILIVDPLTGEVLRAGLNCSSMSSCQKCMGLEIYSALANVNYHVEPMADNHIVLYCIVLYCIVLYCIVLYCIVLYCIASS